MAIYSFSRHVAALPERVFDLWTDLDRMREWTVGVTKVDEISGPADRTGSTYTVWFGRSPSHTVVVEAERPRYIRTRFGTSILAGESSATFEPEGDGTRMTHVVRTEGLLPAIFGRIFATGSWTGSFRGELATFARIAEGEGGQASVTPS
jgi:uncharacterized protein YndB with AHSA1/START domain